MIALNQNKVIYWKLLRKEVSIEYSIRHLEFNVYIIFWSMIYNSISSGISIDPPRPINLSPNFEPPSYLSK